MREIKFRAWDGEKMYKNALVGGYEETVPAVWQQGNGWVHLTQSDLMQYTGLKDKNGVEIYEGDYIKEAESHILQVMFTNLSWCVKWKDSGETICEPISGAFNGDEISHKQMKFKYYEVIGNIHENKELL